MTCTREIFIKIVYKSFGSFLTLVAKLSEREVNFIKMFAKVKIKKLFFLLLVFLAVDAGVDCLKVTIEQMKQSTEPIRMVCMQKTKVSEESLTSLREGKPDDQRELKCYVNCVFEMMQMVR